LTDAPLLGGLDRKSLKSLLENGDAESQPFRQQFLAHSYGTAIHTERCKLIDFSYQGLGKEIFELRNIEKDHGEKKNLVHNPDCEEFTGF
jgi:hypothetical protein